MSIAAEKSYYLQSRKHKEELTAKKGKNESKRLNSVSGTKFQAQEQKISPCVGRVYRCGFLFSARKSSLHLRAYLVQFDRSLCAYTS